MLTRTRSILALLLVAVLLAACGGAASPSPAASGPTPVPPSEPASPANGTPTAGATDEPSGGADVDLGDAARALEGIDSYRVAMTIEGASDATVAATVIRQPEPAQQFSISSGASTQNIIVIGSQAWLDPGTGSYQPVPGEMAAGLSQAFDPVVLIGGFSNPLLQTGLETVGQEERNGVQTTHYRLDPESLAGQMASLPPDAAMDLWLAEAGYLVAFEASNLDPTTTLVRMDITNINDPANQVDAPG